MATSYPIVPQGIWICGGCGDMNTLAIAPEVCPNPSCAHVRDVNIGCCKNPGNQCSDDGDMWHCNECGADNGTWFGTTCPICGATKQSALSSSRGFTSVPGAGSTADGAWECEHCECPNSGWQDHCGNCGNAK